MLFAIVTIGYEVVLSLLVVLFEELSFHRYHRFRDGGIALAAGSARTSATGS